MTASARVLTRPRPRPRLGILSSIVVWGLVAFFFLNLFMLISTVVLNSFADTWFASWLPDAFTTSWYADAWREFNLGQVLFVTGQVAVVVVVVSILIGVPAAYALARRNFPGKRIVTLLFLLPILIPPITYGIPLATLLYKINLAGSLPGVIVANLVPTIPFVVLVMIPFIEQIDPKIEAAARMCGASTLTVFVRILGPLMMPGVLAAAILVLVRTVGMFDLTFLTAGPDSSTLVVQLFAAVSGAGIRAPQTIDAMAVVYTGSMLILLLTALRFVNPTALVGRVERT